ncbi:MAG: c-type cytochrome [Saprospiraceae bacterium]
MKFSPSVVKRRPADLLSLLLCPLLFMLPACDQTESSEPHARELPAANEAVANYARSFEGRGDLTDDSQPISPDQVLSTFSFPEDLELDLLAAEPLVEQPVEINFDHRGRLWVVQYGQYPYPAGLKITGYDYHLRAQFDKVPLPPPEGAVGDDKITLLEDTDGDGVYDKTTDAITGLNIATAVTWGRGKIWVLNPPYLLAYPDPDGDGFPDGDPEVKLRGFGLEDTHAVANSLRWGPDGWLYGAQGSTTTANISSSVTKNVKFSGQGIWRYHPETEIFELFAEGGGNTFHLEIDDKGRIYSGHNGGEARGQYYKQGAYYPKNWGKHGPLTNPYSFGYLDHMGLEGERLRFTHAFLRYGGSSLPERYDDALIAINPLHNFIQVSHFTPMGSTFKTVDQERLLTSTDHWFRPVDIKAGPDGGVYLADWYDSRLTHVDPRDTWHRASGRVYRLIKKGAEPEKTPDFSRLSNEELIAMLHHSNRWMRQQALRQFGDRRDTSVFAPLRSLLGEERGQIALEALWALHLSGGFAEKTAIKALSHVDPFVRMWAVRLLGDQKQVTVELSSVLIALAQRESHPEVRSQLACSAKRLTDEQAMPIIRALIETEDQPEDPNNPLLIWWALESKAETSRKAIIQLFSTPEIWDKPIVREVLLSRLMQRYIMAGGPENRRTATELLKKAPSAEAARPLLNGLTEGLRGQSLADLPPELTAIVTQYRSQLGENILSLTLRRGDEQALEQVVLRMKDPQIALNEQLEYVKIAGEVDLPGLIPILLDLVQNNSTSPALRQAALQSLSRYVDQSIEQVADWYPDRLRADRDVRNAAQDLLISRPEWAELLLQKIQQSRQIAAEDLPREKVQQLLLFEDEAIRQAVRQIWPDILPLSPEEKNSAIIHFRDIIKNGPSGQPEVGKALFARSCASCHQLFGQGGHIGPDLTGYERKNLDYLLLHIVDPNADIREGFVNYSLVTRDGRHLSGVLEDNSGNRVRLRTLSGTTHVFSDDQISSLQAVPVSLMPERLLDSLTEQQVRDLFSYLMGG